MRLINLILTKIYNLNIKEIKQVGIGTLLVNEIFRNIFRINNNSHYRINYTSRVSDPENIHIINKLNSNNAIISLASSNSLYLQAKSGIFIDSSVYIASGVKIISSNHDVLDKSKHINEYPIRILKNVWIGANAILLPGVTIGENSIVGAGAVVTRCVPANCIVVGNPARILKSI